MPAPTTTWRPDVPFRLSRRYLDLQGEPITPGNLDQGQLGVVELTIDSSSDAEIPNIAIVDRLAAGLEIENPRLGRGHSLDWLPQDGLFEPEYVEVRDDRLQLFGTLPRRSRHHKQAFVTRKFFYVVRAVTPGTFTAPPARLEVMYDPEQVYYTDYAHLEIK